MQKVYKSLKEIEEVVNELLPPSKNHLIGSFKLCFYLSTLEWDKELPQFKRSKEVTILGARNIVYYIFKATPDQEMEYLMDIYDPFYQYTDDHRIWKAQNELNNRMSLIKKLL